MEQYIPKSDVVAEIERRIKVIPRGETDKRLKAVYGNEAFVLNDLLSFIDTLEVKGVDLEKEIEDYWHNSDLSWCRDAYSMTHIRTMLSSIAKHFFELGVNASNPLTWEDIRDIAKMWIESKTPYGISGEALSREVLKRFKAQKL